MLELMRMVRECWDMKKDLYEENWEIQLLRRELDLAEAWMTAKEGFLSDPSYGHSVSDVENHLKKHQDFEKILKAQEEKFAQLNRKTKRELKLLKQIDAKETGQQEKGKMIKVPSLRRRHSSRRTSHTKHLDPKRTQPLPSISSTDTLRIPLECTVSPTQESKKNFHQFSLREDLVLTDSSDVNVPPSPVLPGLQNSGLETHNSLLSSLPSNLKIQRVDSDLIQPHTSDFKPSNMEHVNGGALSDVETKEVTNVPSSESFDISATLPSLDLPSQRSETAFQVRANHQIMEGFLEKRDQILPGRRQPMARGWNRYYVKLGRQNLYFYNDEKEAFQNTTPILSLSIAGAKCEKLTEYSRKEHAFSLRLSDGSEYYFAAPSQKLMEDWMQTLWTTLGHHSRQRSLRNELLATTNAMRPQIKPWISAAGSSAHKEITKSLLLRRTPSFKVAKEKKPVGNPQESEGLAQDFSINFAQDSEDSDAASVNSMESVPVTLLMSSLSDHPQSYPKTQPYPNGGKKGTLKQELQGAKAEPKTEVSKSLDTLQIPGRTEPEIDVTKQKKKKEKNVFKKLFSRK